MGDSFLRSLLFYGKGTDGYVGKLPEGNPCTTLLHVRFLCELLLAGEAGIVHETDPAILAD